jgi:putative phosphoribosyl transferase
MVIFKDRESAGILLADKFKERVFDLQKTVVLGIPRGGVVVAKEIAKAYKLPLDIVITKKISAPHQKELALGAVDPLGNFVWEEELLKDFRIKKEELKDEVEAQLSEIKRREVEYRNKGWKLKVKGKVVILVDDGVATGATFLSAIKYVKHLGAKEVIAAVPVILPGSISKISKEVDEVIALHSSDRSSSVGSFYQEFSEVRDEEVKKILKSSF